MLQILYKPIYKCQLCGTLGEGKGYTQEEIDDVMQKMVKGKANMIIRHNCGDGKTGIMQLIGFMPSEVKDI